MQNQNQPSSESDMECPTLEGYQLSNGTSLDIPASDALILKHSNDALILDAIETRHSILKFLSKLNLGDLSNGNHQLSISLNLNCQVSNGKISSVSFLDMLSSDVLPESHVELSRSLYSF